MTGQLSALQLSLYDIAKYNGCGHASGNNGYDRDRPGGSSRRLVAKKGEAVKPSGEIDLEDATRDRSSFTPAA
jgi:hypothetical protein